jgi:hypothetical protein
MGTVEGSDAASGVKRGPVMRASEAQNTAPGKGVI